MRKCLISHSSARVLSLVCFDILQIAPSCHNHPYQSQETGEYMSDKLLVLIIIFTLVSVKA